MSLPSTSLWASYSTRAATGKSPNGIGTVSSRWIRGGPRAFFAGTGDSGYGGDGGPATKASFALPHDTVIGDHILYFADTKNAAARAIDLKTGIINTVAGTVVKGYSGDGGPAKDAKFNLLVGLSLSPDDKRLILPT